MKLIEELDRNEIMNLINENFQLKEENRLLKRQLIMIIKKIQLKELGENINVVENTINRNNTILKIILQ